VDTQRARNIDRAAARLSCVWAQLVDVGAGRCIVNEFTPTTLVTQLIALLSIALEFFVRGVIAPLVALALLLAGYRPAFAAAPLEPTADALPVVFADEVAPPADSFDTLVQVIANYAAIRAAQPDTRPLEQLTYTELKHRCYDARVRPGHSKVSAIAALHAVAAYDH
jgi:hypothetical protein